MDLRSEEFQCPICFNIPEKEIFQCVEGHILCDQCSATPNLRDCPQCKAPLVGSGKSRNRALETLLDKMQFDCVHSGMGCTQKLDRKDLSSHGATCKFGQTLEFCKLLGYTNCGFKAQSLSLHEIIPSHLQELHGSKVVLTKGKSHVIDWDHFYQVNHPQRMQPQCYILKEKDHLPALLLVCRIQDDFATWTCIELGAVGRPHHISRTRYELPAIPVTAAEKFLKQPPFRMSIPYIAEFGGNSKAEKCTNLEFSVKILAGVEVAIGNGNGVVSQTPGEVSELDQHRPQEVRFSDSTNISLLVRYVALGRVLRTGTTIWIQGKVPETAGKISFALLSLRKLPASRLQCDIPLNIICHLRRKVIKRNSYYCGHGWSAFQKVTTAFPLSRGGNFLMTITCDAVKGYSVHINGVFCFVFLNQINMDSVTTLECRKAIISQVTVDQ